MDYGIKVLKYNISRSTAYEERLDKELSDTSIYSKKSARSFNEDLVHGSKYLLSIDGHYHPNITCLTGEDATVYTLFVEITDIETHEVIFTIKAKGFDSGCGYCRKTIYENIAEKINEYFDEVAIR